MVTNQPNDGKPTTTDQILDLLLDALLEREKTRRAQAAGQVPLAPESPPEASPPPASTQRPTGDRAQRAAGSQVKPVPGEPLGAAAPPEGPKVDPSPASLPAGPPAASPGRPSTLAPAANTARTAGSGEDKSVPPTRRPQPGDDDWQLPPREPTIHLGKTIGRLAILVAVLVVLINIPVNRYGVSLARVMPDSASLIIRNGLVLKGSGPEIYRLEDNKLRWITSLDLFEYLGLTWDVVHVVDDKFLAQFEKGAPIYLLLKCDGSPHIYALENGQKRWIKDIETFTAHGFKWDDIKFVTCEYLRGLPDGVPIPEDAGTPPQP